MTRFISWPHWTGLVTLELGIVSLLTVPTHAERFDHCNAKCDRTTTTDTCVPWPIVVPVARLREARQHFGATNNYTTEFPHWVNRTLLTIGQRFLAKNFVGFEYSIILTTLLPGVDIQRVLISAGNTDTTRAAKRFLSALLNFWYWTTVDFDVTNEAEDLFESLNLIHAIHAKMGYEASRRHEMYTKPLIPAPLLGQCQNQDSFNFNLQTPVWEAFERDILSSPLREFRTEKVFPPLDGPSEYPLNQFSLTMQLGGFIIYSVISPETMLMGKPSDEELWGFLHFWAFIGRGLGMADEYNLCLQPDVQTAKIYFREMLTEYYLPGLLNMPYEHKVMVEVTLEATTQLTGYGDLGFVLHRVCVDLLRIECPNLYSTMNVMAKILNAVVDQALQPLSNFELMKDSTRFFVNQLVQNQATKLFNISTFLVLQENFTQLVLTRNTELLRTAGVYWNVSIDEPSQLL